MFCAHTYSKDQISGEPFTIVPLVCNGPLYSLLLRSTTERSPYARHPRFSCEDTCVQVPIFSIRPYI